MEKISGVVIDIIKHSDRHNVVALYTRSHARVSFIVAAGAGKAARLRNAALMPLSVIEADVNFKADRQLQSLTRFSRGEIWRDLYFNPSKSAIALFIAEFLNRFLRDSPPDPHTYDFIIDTIRQLDNCQQSPANLHLAFLIEFLKYAGITPDISEIADDAWFDMREGLVTRLPIRHSDLLAPQETLMIPMLMRMTIRNAHKFRFNAGQRRLLLSRLLRYYAIHFPGLSSLKSPEILAEVFS